MTVVQMELDQGLFYTFSILSLCAIFNVARAFRDEIYYVGNLINKVDVSTQTEEPQTEDDNEEELLNSSITEHVVVHNPARRFSIW